MVKQSKFGKLNSEDLKKILKGAGIAFAGAFLLSLGTALQGGDIISWPAVIGAGISVGVNAAIKVFSGTK